MLSFIHRFLLPLGLLLFIAGNQAFSVDVLLPRWQSDGFAETYIVQLAKDYYFHELVREERVNTTELRLDLEPGVYFVRIAGSVRQFRGNWSSPRRFFVEAPEEDNKQNRIPDPEYVTNYYYYLAIQFKSWSSERTHPEIEKEHRDQYAEIALQYYQKAYESNPDYIIPTYYNAPILRVGLDDGNIYQYCNPNYFVLNSIIEDMIDNLYATATYYGNARRSTRQFEMFSALIQIDPFHRAARRYLLSHQGDDILQFIIDQHKEQKAVRDIFDKADSEETANNPITSDIISDPEELQNEPDTRIVPTAEEDTPETKIDSRAMRPSMGMYYPYNLYLGY